MGMPSICANSSCRMVPSGCQSWAARVLGMSKVNSYLHYTLAGLRRGERRLEVRAHLVTPSSSQIPSELAALCSDSRSKMTSSSHPLAGPMANLTIVLIPTLIDLHLLLPSRGTLTSSSPLKVLDVRLGSVPPGSLSRASSSVRGRWRYMTPYAGTCSVSVGAW